MNMLTLPSIMIPGGWKKKCAFRLTVRSLRGLARVPKANIRTSASSTISCIMGIGLSQKARDSERTLIHVSDRDKLFCNLSRSDERVGVQL